MPYELQDLIVDRVDFVDEGANSAAFIELYKRKETKEPMDLTEIMSKLKPEHAEVIQKALDDKDAVITANAATIASKDADLTTANEALSKANAELEALKEKPKAEDSETELLKSMPESARAMFEKMRLQKEAAEEEVRKAAEREAEAAAVAKAASMKAIPVPQEQLVSILKNCTPEIENLLSTISKAIDVTVLDEIGKNRGNGATSASEDAWTKLEKKAEEIAKRDSVTKEKAMRAAISEYPELYREYVNGGAK